MDTTKLLYFLKEVLHNMPKDWVELTTHRLDIYNEKLAKTEFITALESLYSANKVSETALSNLPTAYDYIRLGHPLSSVLEWVLGQLNDVASNQVISFSSQTMPLLAVLRKNALEGQKTTVFFQGELPELIDATLLQEVYGYDFELVAVNRMEDIPKLAHSTVFLSHQEKIGSYTIPATVDFFIDMQPNLGSIIIVKSGEPESYISEIQHVRRRESIAMTPADCFTVLRTLVVDPSDRPTFDTKSANTKNKVIEEIKKITGTNTQAQLGSSGLSIQYAIMMGLVDEALEKHKGKPIKFLVPPNCYGGTNDQARRVAASIANAEVLDLPVDRDNDMVQSVDKVLEEVAKQDAVPYIIAEIPTNPRVEVPNLIKLKEALEKKRHTPSGSVAIAPVFILDQTFCPNVHFLGEGEILSDVKAIAYVSGSKFPSGGKCTAGYCVANTLAAPLLQKIETHLRLCDNGATDLQLQILAAQLPSMNQRIKEAYVNTREFVTFIQEKLPEAKINFVSETLAAQGFTPSVFSLDLPTKGATAEEKEAHKRALNQKLIDMMITQIPKDSKYCVSYGQLKGCYWTIPATSTQGTTKEKDKDYIARVSVSPDLDLEKHKEVFLEFVNQM
ncbi:cystathionine beta-synthase [Aquimarina brevivitae]|uniref:Cys/Met metabolism PLP-dependent enzyme n=1 Tax=Aquimarina brevivitae TaxID=323412 RepID=A0A4Q7NX00_9FLAO|nr:cystathionine beta-synthase [Aquimarina brevivitae]RZS91871.1 hypothetical protein EV197_2974 [Aquimarina brevivitae]